jgi:hypothetical protein
MSNDNMHKGGCFCGAVELAVKGAPAAMGYCHCESCRHWSAGPVNAFTLWKPDQVEVTKGKELIGSFSKTPRSDRKWCTKCGGHLMTNHPQWGLVDVYAAVLKDLAYEPHVHVNYGEHKLRVRDGLPKQNDFPAEMGGSGKTLEE